MRVLLAVSRYPWPATRGDQLRAAQVVELLSRQHQVTLLAPAPGGNRRVPAIDGLRVETYERGGIAAGLGRSLARGLPFQAGLYYRADLRRRLRRLVREHEVGILQLVRLAAHAADFGELPLVVDLVDSLALNFERRALFDQGWRRPALRREAKRLARAETELAARAGAAVVVCERDRRSILERAGRRSQGSFPSRRLRVIPLASSATPIAASDGPHPPILAFTGNLGYFVNVDAIVGWLGEVWPALHRRRPDLRLVVAGARPARRLRRAVAAAGAELVESPLDLTELLATAAVSLAPLRAGSGQPIKILEAWSVGVPVVASPWAAAGTEAVAGEHLLVADTPDEWIEAIQEVLDHKEVAERLATAGRRLLAETYSPSAVAKGWLETIDSL